ICRNVRKSIQSKCSNKPPTNGPSACPVEKAALAHALNPASDFFLITSGKIERVAGYEYETSTFKINVSTNKIHICGLSGLIKKDNPKAPKAPNKSAASKTFFRLKRSKIEPTKISLIT